MGVIRLENQAVKLYEQNETLFNDKTSKCEWHLDHHQLATCEDISEIILNTEVLETDLQTDGDFDTNVTGTTLAPSPNQLVDPFASFLTSVSVGMHVRNTTNDTLATITNIVDDTTIDLSSDIFVGASDYSISFYEMTGGMDITGGQLVQTSGTAGTAKQDALQEKFLLYKVQIDIQSFESTTPGDKINFKIGGVTVLSLDETTVNTGSFTMLGFNTETDFTEFEITCDSGIDAIFDNLVISKYSNSVFFILEAETNEVIYYSAIEDVLTSSTQDQIKLSVEWLNVISGYTCEGCYYIVILDDVDYPSNVGAEKIVNGDFTTDTDWAKGTNWTISGGTATVNGFSSGELGQNFSSLDLLSAGLSYDITVEVSNYADGIVNIELDAGEFGRTDVGQASSNGTFTFSTGVLAISQLGIVVSPTNTSLQDYSIDNLSVVVNPIDSGFTYRTDNFNLSDSHDCTIKLSGLNNDNAFGIDFIGLNYNPFVRVEGELETPIFNGEKVNEEDSFGVSETLYFKSEKISNLFLYQLPNHFHNFIRLLIGYDSFLIDDVEYNSVDAEYVPEAERLLGKLPDTSNATKEVRLKEDLNKNKFC